jgi:hypothetical protein
MSLTKLGAVERLLGVLGVLAFIDSFLPWFTVSFLSTSLSTNGWTTGIGGWLPVLLLVALGVGAVLPAFGVNVSVRGGYLLYALAAALATVIVLIRWVTYPSVGADYSAYMSVGASAGTFVGLGLAIAATAVAYRGFVKGGGSLSRFGEAFAKQNRD